mgnify:CR=1 FL=1
MDIQSCINLNFTDDGSLADDPFETLKAQSDEITDLFFFAHGMNASVSAADRYRSALVQALTVGEEVMQPNRRIGMCGIGWNADSGTAHWDFITTLRPRAAKIAEVGLAPLLKRLAQHRRDAQKVAQEKGGPAVPDLRMHLVAHSTGTVIAAHVLTSDLGTGPESPVKSVFLLQGVLPVNIFATGTFGDSDAGRLIGKISSEGIRWLGNLVTFGQSAPADLQNRLIKAIGALAGRDVHVDGPIVATKSFTDDNLAFLVVIPGEQLPIGREGFFAVDTNECDLRGLGASYSFSGQKFHDLNIRPEVGNDHNACIANASVAWANLNAAGLVAGSLITQLGGEAWSDTRAMTSLDGSLYVIQNNKLWRANPGDGSYTQLGEEVWSNTSAMASLGGSLYVIQNGKLWRANPGDGSYTQLGGEEWNGTAAMTAGPNGLLYVVQNGKLWRVNPNDGAYAQLGGQDWNDTRAMTSVGGALHIIQNGKLWRANPNDGVYIQLGGQDWNDTAAMTAGPDGKLYVVQNSKLWRAQPDDGRYERLYDSNWKDTRAMACIDRRLYIIQNNRLWQVKLPAAV